MSIHKTKSGNYQVRWRVDGRLQAKNCDRKFDAEKFEASQKVKTKADYQDQKVESVPSLTFNEFSELWIRDYGMVHKTEGSLVHDRQMIRDYLSPAWGNWSLTDVAKRDVAQLQAALVREKRLSSKTINMIVGLVHKMFKTATEWDYLRANTAGGIPPLRLPEKEYRFWTFEERDRFLSWARANDPTLYFIVAVAVNTGMRPGEVQGLLRDCVDLDRRFIIVKRSYCRKTHKLNEYTKGKKIRWVPMNNLVHQLLKEKSLISSKDQVLPADYDHFVVRQFRPAQDKSGVSPICFHDLRHTFASHLAMSGISAFDIQKVLGHASIDTTMRYMHLAPEHLAGLTDVLLPKNASKLISM